MNAARLDLEIEQGAEFDTVFRWEDKDENPIDVTGYTGEMIIKDEEDGTIIDTLTSADGDISTINNEGGFRVYIPASETSNYNFNWAVYMLEVTPPSGADNKKRLAEGTIKLDKEI